VSRRNLALLTLGVVAVSFSSVLVRLATDEGAPPLAIAFYRCAFAAVILLPIAVTRHRVQLVHLPRRRWILLVGSGVALAAHFATWIPSISLTTIAASAVLVQTTPIWVALLGRFLGERPARGAPVGVAVALIGTLVISGGGFEGDARAIVGDLLAVAGAIFAAVYVLLGRSLRQELSVAAYTGVVYTVSAVVLAVIMLGASTPFAGFSAEVWALLVLITVGPQFGGHTVFNYLLEQLRASVVAIALLAEPVGATILAFAILGEAPGVATLIGGAVVLVGVFLAIRAESQATVDEAIPG
jgi:drug/metabolite transporter (DMT)-like permease